MTDGRPLKRPMAGAICPECGLEDKIFIETTPEGDFRQCVACGFSDRRPDSHEMSEESNWSPVKLPEK